MLSAPSDDEDGLSDTELDDDRQFDGDELPAGLSQLTPMTKATIDPINDKNKSSPQSHGNDAAVDPSTSPKVIDLTQSTGPKEVDVKPTVQQGKPKKTAVSARPTAHRRGRQYWTWPQAQGEGRLQ